MAQKPAYASSKKQAAAVKLEASVVKAEAAAARGDHKLAAKLLNKAATAGHVYASALLGAWQVLGYQMPADSPAGLARLREAAAQGESSASAFLANLYASGLTIDQDWSQALHWLAEAARWGNARALTQLALLIEGQAPDPVRINLLLAAASREFAPAQWQLGMELLASKQIQYRDVAQAWIGSAARAGHPAAIEAGGLELPFAKPGQVVSLQGADFSQVLARCDLSGLLAVPVATRHFDDPQIETFERLIPERFCHYVMGLSAPQMQRARVNDIERGELVHDMRTNSDMRFSVFDSDPVLQLINHRLALATALPVSHQERTTVLHYLPGQTYKAHYDFIDPAVPLFHDELATRGQRCATALIYLSTHFEGGETDFPHLDWRFKGGAGDAIVFRNITDTGEPALNSLHTGLPPTSGEKWLLSKWVRDSPQPVLP